MGVGLRLKIALREKKMTIKELSALSGVSLNTLYSITKRDTENVDDIILSCISSTLDLSWAFFMGCAPFENLEFLHRNKEAILLELEKFNLFSRDGRDFSDVGNYEFWQLLSNTVIDVTKDESGNIHLSHNFTLDFVQEDSKSKDVDSLLAAFNKLEYGGRKLVIEYAELLASNPGFLLKESKNKTE